MILSVVDWFCAMSNNAICYAAGIHIRLCIFLNKNYMYFSILLKQTFSSYNVNVYCQILLTKES